MRQNETGVGTDYAGKLPRVGIEAISVSRQIEARFPRPRGRNKEEATMRTFPFVLVGTSLILGFVAAPGCQDPEVTPVPGAPGGQAGEAGGTLGGAGQGGAGGTTAGGSAGAVNGGEAGSTGEAGAAGAGAAGAGEGGSAGAPEAGSAGTTEAGSAGTTEAGGAGAPGGECPLPEDGLLAEFQVEGEQFRATLLEESAIESAIALYRGESQANIPNGALICEPADYNCNYTWHLDPMDIEFAKLTIEVCDGTPSYIEDNCEDFGARYCPWSAELVELRDCRETGCPMVERM